MRLSNYFLSRKKPLFRYTIAWMLCFVMTIGLIPIGTLKVEGATEQWVALNLINGGFEQPVDENGKIPGWENIYGKNGFTVTSEKSIEGVNSLYLENLKANQNYAMQSEFYPATPGSVYSANSSVHLLEGSVSIYLQFHSGDDNKTRIGHKSQGQSNFTEGLPLTAKATAPEGTEYVSVLLYGSKAAMTKAYFDNVVLSVNAPVQKEPPTNDVLINPGFEEPLDADGQIVGWQQTYGKGGFTVTDENKFSGKYSLYMEDLQTNQSYGVQSVYIPAEAGVTYTVAVNTYVLEGQAIIYLQFHSGDNERTRIGHKSIGQTELSKWLPLTATAKAPDGTEYMTVLIYSGPLAVKRVYFDDVTIGVAAQEPEEPVGADHLVRIGTAINSITIPHAAFGKGPEGENYIYTTANGLPAVFSVLRAETGERVASFELKDASYSWGSTVAPNGDVYIGTQRNGTLYRYRPADNTIDNLGRAIDGEGLIWRVVSDEKGRIFGGTYPGGKVFRYDPAANEYADFGRMAAEENYVRSITYGGGKVYAGTGAQQAQLFELNPDTGAKKAIELPEGFRQHKEIYDLTYTAGLLFARLTYFDPSSPLDNVTLVYDTVKEEWTKEITNTIGFDVSPLGPDGNIYFLQNGVMTAYHSDTGEIKPTSFTVGNVASRGFGWYDLNLPDMPGESVVSITSRGRIMAYNPETKKGRWIEGDPLGSANSLRSVATGPDGNIYIGGYLSPSSMTRFNIDTFKMETLSGMGQIEGMGMFGNKLYMGLYPGSLIYEYDPTLPWDPKKTNPRKLDIELSPIYQDRPFAFVEAGDKLAIGTVPIVGKLGGALTLYDPVTETYESFHQIVEDESPMALAYKDGLLYGGTTVWGGVSVEPVKADGTLFIFDMKTKEKVFEINPVEGERAITALTFDEHGMLWGLTNGMLFKFDPVKREVVQTKTIHPFEWKSIVLAGGYLNFHDGYLYGEAASRIFRLDPVTWEHTILSVGNYFAQDEYGRIFTVRNSMDLYMYDDIAPIFAADASLQYEWTEDGGLVLEWPVNADMKKFQITRDGVDVTANGELSREGGNGTAKFNMAADFAEPGAYEVTTIDYAGNESEEALAVLVNEQPDDVTLEGLDEQLEAYISSGDVRGPLVNQLSNSLRQARHHYLAGRTAQATKQLEDFLKRMNNPPMGRHIEADAKQTLEQAVHELLVQWDHVDTD